MAKSLPKHIVCGPNKIMSLYEASLGNNALGCINFEKEEIVIERSLPLIGKHSILLHEMIHLANEKLIASGLEKIQPIQSEEYVTQLAGVLFLILAQSGLWNGVTPEEAEQFYKKQKD